MFTVTCITCEAKIRVKDESLAGQIVACPHCGSMVLLEPETSLSETPHPESEHPNDPPDSASPPPFPPTHSVSPIPPPIPESLDAPDAALSSEPAISEKEIRLRKGLLAVLGALLVFLLLVTGLLVFFGGEIGEESPPGTVETRKTKATKGTASSEIVAANPIAEEPVGQDVAVKPSDGKKELARTPETTKTPTSASTTNTADTPMSGETAEVPFGFRKLAQDVKTPTGMSHDEPSESRDDETGTDLAGNSDTPSPDADSIEADRNRLLEMLKSRSDSNPLDVDVNAKLEFVVPELRLENVPLLDALRTLSRLADVPITLDCESLQEAAVNVDRPIRVVLESQNVGTILENLLKPLGLTTIVELGQITVTADPVVGRHRLPVDDLLPIFAEKRLPEMLATLIPLPEAHTLDTTNMSTTAERADVADTSSTPGFSLDGGDLCFQGSRKAANQVLKFLETLRVLHKLPQRSPLQGEMLAPEAFGWDTVCQKKTLNFFRAEPLERILTLVEKTTPVPNGSENAVPTGEDLADDVKKEDGDSGPGSRAGCLRILVDHRTLHRNFTIFVRLRSTVHCDGGTLDEAMENLLASTEGLPLDYRIVAKNVLEVSTPEDLALPEKMSVELHLLPQSLQRLSGTTRTEQIAEFLETFRKTLAPDSWADTVNGGTLVVDEAAGALFVRQSQPVQRQIRRMILELDLEQFVTDKSEADKPGTIGEPAGTAEEARP